MDHLLSTELYVGRGLVHQDQSLETKIKVRAVPRQVDVAIT